MKSLCLALSLVVAAACGGSEERIGPNDPGPGDLPPIEGTNYQYVVSKLRLPADEADAGRLAVDVDGNGVTDNKLGQTLVILKGLNVDIQKIADEALAKGQLTLLLNLRTPDLRGADLAGLWALFGTPRAPACSNPEDLSTCGKHLTGGAEFKVLPDSPTDQFLPGKIVSSRFDGGPGSVSVALPLSDGELFSFQMTSARSSFQGSERKLEAGILGGAIVREELDANVLPAIHHVVEGFIASDCTGTAPSCCKSGTSGSFLVLLMDEDKNCKVSLQEFRDNPQVQEMFGLDLDLYNKDGKFAPNEDGILDSLSFGLGFDAVNASFPALDLK